MKFAHLKTHCFDLLSKQHVGSLADNAKQGHPTLETPYWQANISLGFHKSLLNLFYVQVCSLKSLISCHCPPWLSKNHCDQMGRNDFNPVMPNKRWRSIDLLIQKINQFYWPYQMNKMMWTTRRFCMVSLWKTSNYLISNVDWVLNKCKFCTFLSPQNSFFCISLSA